MSRAGFGGIIVYVPHGAASPGATPTAVVGPSAAVEVAPAWARPAAVAALVTSEAAVAVAAWALTASGLRWDLLLTSYAVTNAWMAATFAPFGALVASSRPRLVVGWLFCGFALCYSLSALGISLAIWRATAGGPTHWSSTLGWLGVFIWTPAVAVFFPLIILLFPSGHLPAPCWKWLAGVVVVLGGTWLLGWAFDPSAVSGMPFVTYRPVVASGAWGALAHGANNVGNVLVEVVAVTCVLTLVWRWQCSRAHERAQLSWLVAGATAALLLFAPTAANEGALWSTLLLVGVPVLPLAATIAVLRYQLLGIDLVINRTLVYLTLSAALLACYLGVVELSAAVVGHGGGFAGPLVAAAVVAVAFSPARQFLQRRVDTLMFGSRRDPSRALSEVTVQLQSSSDNEPEASLRAVSQSLHLPDLALVTDGRRVGPPSTGEGVETVVPLRYGAREVGQLLVRPRRGQTRLDASDLAALRLVAVPISSAVYALQLTKRLQRAQDEERRRLHRDLHDGLGPMLTAMALRADAAGNVSSKDGAKAHDLIAEVGDQARQAIAEVRRISHNLRPTSLDQLGLLGALASEAGRFGDRLGGQALAVTTDFPAAVPRLGLEVENAAYRIVTEALTNIARHSGATAAVVRVRAGQVLCVEVLDNGAGGSDGWAEGFGIASMRARASDVGGQLCAGPIPSGGRVWAKLPLGTG